MNKFIYNEIKEYEHDRYDINAILYDIVEEAETVTSTDDGINKQNFAKKLLDRAKKLIASLIALVNRKFTKLRLNIQRVLQSDDGFKKKAREAMINNKPLENIKVIAYVYNENFIESVMNNITNTIMKTLANLNTHYSENSKIGNDNPMDMDENSLIKYIMEKSSIPKNVENINLLFDYMKKGYRVEKKEQMFSGDKSKTAEYYQIATGFEKLQNVVNQRESICNRQVNVIKQNLTATINNKMSQNEVKQRALKQSSNASHLFNFYCAVLSVYTQLKLEKIMSYRIIMKKLFHFS